MVSQIPEPFQTRTKVIFSVDNLVFWGRNKKRKLGVKFKLPYAVNECGHQVYARDKR